MLPDVSGTVPVKAVKTVQCTVAYSLHELPLGIEIVLCFFQTLIPGSSAQLTRYEHMR